MRMNSPARHSIMSFVHMGHVRNQQPRLITSAFTGTLTVTLASHWFRYSQWPDGMVGSECTRRAPKHAGYARVDALNL